MQSRKLDYYISTENVTSETTLKVLDAIIKLGPTYQHEIAKETGFRDSTIQYSLGKFWRAKIIRRVAATDEETGRLVKKIDFAIDKTDAKQAIKHFKDARKSAKKGLSILEQSLEKYSKKRASKKPFRLNDSKKQSK